MSPILQEIENSFREKNENAGDDDSTTEIHLVDIPVGHEPPASIEGQSAVYLLHIFPKKSKTSGQQGVFYVGETESLNQRLRQHRMFYKRGDCLVHCLAFNVPNKSLARALETKLITTLKTKGYSFDRDSDAAHSLFSRSLR
jgi:predicted GIY-YIG superfamily endonuclease